MFRNLRDEIGNAASSVVLAILAAIIGGTLVTIAVSLVSTIDGTAAANSASDAVSARYADYLADPDDLSEICYPASDTCVSITADGAVVTLTADHGEGDYIMSRDRATVTTVTHISGFDSDGNPIWVSVEDFDPF